MRFFRIRLRITWIIAALQLFCLPNGFACTNVILVSSNSHFGLLHHIEAALELQPNPKPKLIHVLASAVKGNRFWDPYHHACMIVTVGSEALAMVLASKPPLPIFSVLSRKNTVQTLLKTNHCSMDSPHRPITAIYLDQPLERQIHLLQSILPQQRHLRIGILVGPNMLEEQRVLEKVAKQKKLSINMISIEKEENPISTLDNLLNNTDVILALPHPHIYNPANARGILLSAFHKQVPLIGYSRTYVNNGALAAVYSTTKQIAEQTAQQIQQIVAKKPLVFPPPQYPAEFAIAVNYQVARSLKIAIKSEANLKSTLDKMEKSHRHE